MSQGSINFDDESIEEGIDQNFNQIEGLNISAIQQELVEDLQEIERGIGARVSTDPQDRPTAQLPLLRSPSQESSQLQREQDSNINLTERVIEEAPPTIMDVAARDGLETVPMVASLSTPEEKCSGMFKKKDPIKKELLALGACELPREMRGTTPDKIKKNKDLLTKGIIHLIRLHAFQQTGALVNEDDDGKTSLPTSTTKDALLSNTYLFKLLHTELKASDCQKAINIPKLIDPKGLTPADCWDFSGFDNVILDHASITRERVLLFAEH